MNIKQFFTLAALALATPFAHAQTTDSTQWTYRLTPYLWGTAIDGTVAHDRLPLDLHASMDFGDVWENLELGGMGAFEANRGKYGIVADGLFARMSSTVYAPVAGAALPVDLETRTRTGLIAFRYGWRESDTGHLDLIAGARFWSARTRLSYAIPIPPPPPVPQQFDGTQEESWVDLQVGVRGRHAFSNGMFVGGWALAGAGESNLSTDVMLLAGYAISDRTAVVAGYRWLSTDFETSSGFRYDTTMQGPGLGLEFSF